MLRAERTARAGGWRCEHGRGQRPVGRALGHAFWVEDEEAASAA